MQTLSGHITAPASGLGSIFLNNLVVGGMTFAISCFVFSSLIFVLMWNASILAYYISTFGSLRTAATTGFSLMAHGLLEVGGYALIGIAGSLVAYKIDRIWQHNHDVNSSFIKKYRNPAGLRNYPDCHRRVF